MITIIFCLKMVKLIKGKQLSLELLKELKKEREKIKEKILFGIILVGNDQASLSFIKKKKEIAKELNIDCRLYQFEETVKTKKLRKEVSKICRIPYMRGVIVQLPLPSHINTFSVLNAILEDKDPDVLNERNLGRFYNNRLIILPPVVRAIDFLIKKYKIKLPGKNIVIVGGGVLTGKPLSLYFLNNKISFTLIERNNKNFKPLLKNADIIFSGTGKINLIKGDLIKKGVIVFDLSYNFYKRKIVGDCEFNSVLKKAKIYSPVPNGIGPLTVVFLFQNLLTLTKKALNIK